MKINQIKELLCSQISDGSKCRFYNPDQDIQTLLTDSRNIFNPAQTVFIAIRNKKGNDGHDFIGGLYDEGVKSFITEYIPKSLKDKEDVNIILVNDSIEALVNLGKINRKNAKEVVSITGSRGKTTLKEILFQLLEPLKKISRSPRSYNSQIGVPLSLWQISENTDLAIIEAGISKKGEMKRLDKIIAPDSVIFTNLGDAHSEGFKDNFEKGEEKALLASGANVKTIIYPFDDEIFSKALLPYLDGKQKIGRGRR